MAGQSALRRALGALSCVHTTEACMNCSTNIKCSDPRALRKGPEAWAVGVSYSLPTFAPPGQILSPLMPWMELDRGHLQSPPCSALRALPGSSLSCLPAPAALPLQALGEGTGGAAWGQGWRENPGCHGDHSWSQNAVPENVGRGPCSPCRGENHLSGERLLVSGAPS